MECLIVGTRPQFLKLYGYLKSIESEYRIIHSGQHYDYEMSKTFFDQLKIPEPDINLGIKIGYWQDQTVRTIRKLSGEFKKVKADSVTVFGDCSTTYGGAIAAKQANLPLTHVECGYRHVNPIDPEDFIRTVVDHLSNRLITYNDYAIKNLIEEGVDSNRIVKSDNVMLRALKDSVPIAEKEEVSEEFDYLMTLHRSKHKEKESLSEIMNVLGKIKGKIIFPCHPGTKEKIEEYNISVPANIELREPLGYIKFLALFLKSKAIITDSGGIQVEAFELKKKCITLNDGTCWLHTLENNMNTTVGDDFSRILKILND
ncbi:MAG: UDP-N-acetylglucosamine 2-epimerase [Thermoplasmata archaeon]|nr:MAG: UDP-N-acetylglucosamine 2-epimerase [Thermoplasmata archaeon]